MSWFSFTATSTEVDVIVGNVNCVGGSIGVQTGIYADCLLGECLAADNNCGTNADKTFSLSDLTIGSVYYIYVDGCAGSACNFEIQILGLQPFVLSEPQSIAIEVNDFQIVNDPCDSEERVVLCLGDTIQFAVHHDGSSPMYWGIFSDECSQYSDELDADFVWSFSPSLEGYAQEVWSLEQDGFRIPPITLTTAGEFTVCMEKVIASCASTLNSACVNIKVEECSVTTEELAELEVSIHPNPTTDKIQVNGKDDLQYSIMDVHGQLVQSGIIDESIDLSTISSGCYFLKLRSQNSGSTIVEKIIKL